MASENNAFLFSERILLPKCHQQLVMKRPGATILLVVRSMNAAIIPTVVNELGV